MKQRRTLAITLIAAFLPFFFAVGFHHFCQCYAHPASLCSKTHHELPQMAVSGESRAPEEPQLAWQSLTIADDPFPYTLSRHAHFQVRAPPAARPFSSLS